MLTKDRAVCIRALDYSETSQIVTLFARLSGKLRAIAKGAKRPKSAFDGPIEALSFGAIVFSDPHKDKLATLTEFQQQPVGGALRHHLLALHSALFAAELLNALTDDYDPHPLLFDHFMQLLHDLEDEECSGQRRDVVIRLILFQLVLLSEVGLRPVLDRCANCKRPFSASWRENYFSSTANGLICRDCEMSFPDKVRLSSRAVHCLTDFRQIAQSQHGILDEIEHVLIHHFTETLGHPPKMAKYILGDSPRGSG
jgi:DNA repair protein RecO (recombination protein O)